MYSEPSSHAHTELPWRVQQSMTPCFVAPSPDLRDRVTCRAGQAQGTQEPRVRFTRPGEGAEGAGLQRRHDHPGQRISLRHTGSRHPQRSRRAGAAARRRPCHRRARRLQRQRDGRQRSSTSATCSSRPACCRRAASRSTTARSPAVWSTSPARSSGRTGCHTPTRGTPTATSASASRAVPPGRGTWPCDAFDRRRPGRQLRAVRQRRQRLRRRLHRRPRRQRRRADRATATTSGRTSGRCQAAQTDGQHQGLRLPHDPRGRADRRVRARAGPPALRFPRSVRHRQLLGGHRQLVPDGRRIVERRRRHARRTRRRGARSTRAGSSVTNVTAERQRHRQRT